MSSSTIRCSLCLINNKGDEMTVSVSCVKGKFIMTASVDTTIIIWDLKGEVLASINTNQMTNSHAAISPCGRSVSTHATQYTHTAHLTCTHYTISIVHTPYTPHTLQTQQNINSTLKLTHILHTPYTHYNTHTHPTHTCTRLAHSTHTQYTI